jgi:hypothetical protein
MWGEIARIEKQIEDISNALNIIRDYENPFQYITFMDNANTRVTMEIKPDMISSADENLQKQIKTFQNKSNFISAILSKYSMFDYDNHCKLIHHISIEMKVRILYAERLKYSRYYCDNILPEKYRGLFKMNDYNNIYDLVRCSLIEELESLIGQKIGLLQK